MNALLKISVGTVTFDDREWSSYQDLEIQPERPALRIPQVQPDHIIEAGAAPATHLPQSCNARLHFQHSASVPNVIHLKLIAHRRTRAYQRHFAAQNVQQLREFIEACLA